MRKRLFVWAMLVMVSISLTTSCREKQPQPFSKEQEAVIAIARRYLDNMKFDYTGEAFLTPKLLDEKAGIWEVSIWPIDPNTLGGGCVLKVDKANNKVNSAECYK